ncbi:MAG: hypothetical protein KDA96_12745, partial [Planctomycetaceae bacterium]|nr:hypothetical protein [Planctomycetaceae bacterium]
SKINAMPQLSGIHRTLAGMLMRCGHTVNSLLNNTTCGHPKRQRGKQFAENREILPCITPR